jgi:MarR family transcriptional regulator for hemolysin
MLHYDFEKSIGFRLVCTWNAYERALNAELTPRGITFRQAQVLGYLSLDGELSQVELAERMKVEPPTLVGILDRMERDGWIARCDCADDRRKKIIRAMPRAEPVWAEIVEAAMNVRQRAVEGMASEEVRQLMDGLEQLERNLASEVPTQEQAS